MSRPLELLQLADDLEMAESTLAKLGRSSEIDNQITKIDILKCCKPHVGSKWKRKALDHKEDHDSYPDFFMFVAFI